MCNTTKLRCWAVENVTQTITNDKLTNNCLSMHLINTQSIYQIQSRRPNGYWELIMNVPHTNGMQHCCTMNQTNGEWKQLQRDHRRAREWEPTLCDYLHSCSPNTHTCHAPCTNSDTFKRVYVINAFKNDANRLYVHLFSKHVNQVHHIPTWMKSERIQSRFGCCCCSFIFYLFYFLHQRDEKVASISAISCMYYVVWRFTASTDAAVTATRYTHFWPTSEFIPSIRSLL